MRQRDIDFVIFVTVGSVIGAILHDAGLWTWAIPFAAFVVAIVLMLTDIVIGRAKERFHGPQGSGRQTGRPL